jgi:hypothetical protein
MTLPEVADAGPDAAAADSRRPHPPALEPPALEPPGLETPALELAGTALPGGQWLVFGLYPRALLRTTGFDIRPLQRMLDPGPGPTLDTCLTALREAFRDVRLQEAVAQSNPAFYEIAFAPGRALTTDAGYQELTKHGRRQVRTAHRYLRRLLGKTETNAFFGPTLVAAWDSATVEPLLVSDPAPERCLIGLSHWLVVTLADRQRRELPPSARGWRRDPLWHQQGATLRQALDDRVLHLTESALAVWQALQAPASAAWLHAQTGLPAPEVVTALGLLAPALRPHPRPPSTLIDGLGWLLANRTTHAPPGTSAESGLADQAAGHAGGADRAADRLVERLAGLVSRAQAAGWPESSQLRGQIRAEVAAAGLTTARSAGRHYADRDVVNEDRSSPWTGQVRLGRPAVRSAHRALGHLLPMMLLDALLRQADARDAVVAATHGIPAGLAGLAARRIEPVHTRTARWHALLAELVSRDDGLAVAEIAPADLATAIAGLWHLTSVRDDDQRAALPGLDLMVTGGPPGIGRWVLSECHDDSSSAIGGITSRAQPGGGRDYDRFCATVTQWLDTGRMATVLGRRRSRHVTPELPGLTVELSGTSAKPASEVVPAASVQVSADGAGIEHAGRRYQLYPGDVASPLFRALSLPCLVPVPFATDRRYTPRIVVGDVVVQRRRWVLDIDATRGGTAGATALLDQLAAHDGVTRFFLKHPEEPKPLLADARDPLCRAELARLGSGRVVCTEVLPDLDDTWWRSGGPQASELRIPVLLRWDQAGGGTLS